MMNLYWHSLSFAHSREYIHGGRMSAITSAVTQQTAMEYYMQEKHLSWSKGEIEVPSGFANSCDQQKVSTKIYYCINTWKNTIAYAEKMYKICACRGTGDLYDTHSIIVCTI